jgi:hypothetical protein
MTDGKTHREGMVLPLAPIAERFSQDDVVAATRGAQTDSIRYPEFLKRSAEPV